MRQERSQSTKKSRKKTTTTKKKQGERRKGGGEQRVGSLECSTLMHMLSAFIQRPSRARCLARSLSLSLTAAEATHQLELRHKALSVSN